MELLQHFLQYGILGIVLFFIGWGVLLVARWAAPKIDKIVDTHVDFVKNTDARLGNVEDKITNLDDVAARQTEILARMETNHTSILGNQMSMINLLERNLSNGQNH